MTLAREMALESEYVMGTFARKPVEFVEGHGMTLIDDAGNEYLDFLSGIGVCSLGHCHPSIVQAVSDQAAKLIHVSNYYYIEHRGEVAQLLSNMLNAYVDEPSPETWKTFFRELRRRGQRVRHQAGAPVRPSPHGSRRQRCRAGPAPHRHAGQELSRPHLGDACGQRPSRPSRRPSSRCRPGSRPRPSTMWKRSSACSRPRATASAPS